MLGSAISIAGKLFLVGGITGDVTNPVSLDTIYVYDDYSNSWKVFAKMSQGRLNHATGSYGNYLAVIGGHTIVNNTL